MMCMHMLLHFKNEVFVKSCTLSFKETSGDTIPSKNPMLHKYLKYVNNKINYGITLKSPQCAFIGSHVRR